MPKMIIDHIFFEEEPPWELTQLSRQLQRQVSQSGCWIEGGAAGCRPLRHALPASAHLDCCAQRCPTVVPPASHC